MMEIIIVGFSGLKLIGLVQGEETGFLKCNWLINSD